MRLISAVTVTAIAFLGLAGGSALAERWDGYAPSKEVWNITQVRVRPDKIDAYLDGLRKTWLPAVELAKKNGTLVGYKILVNKDSGTAGANIIIIEEDADWSKLAPNKARDLALRTALQKTVPKEQADKQVEDFDQYRRFIAEGDFWGVVYTK